MCKYVEIIEKNYFSLKEIACDIAFKEALSREDKSRLNNALRGCKLLLLVIKEGSPELYQEQKRDFDSCVEKIKTRFKPSEYDFSGSLKTLFE